jgi:hypothetical protein
VIQTGTEDKEKERRKAKDISHTSGILQIHNNANAPVEFYPGRISPQSQKSLGFAHRGSERDSRLNSHAGDGS